MLPGFKVGHYTDTDAQTGLTVILPEKPARCHYHICGGAPATHELAVLESDHLVDHIDALLLTGGSAFGLSAVAGVMQYLLEKDRGYPTDTTRVPIVPAAAIYDLSVGENIYPDRKNAYFACHDATTECGHGAIGAGTGARVGKLFSKAEKMAGGVGSCSLSLGEVQVTAIAVVNCVGDIIGSEGEIVAGAKINDKFINTQEYLLAGHSSHSELQGQNTTLVAVMTNANFSSSGLKRLAKMACAGIAKAIQPAFTPYDGDIVFALSSGEVEADMLTVGCLAAKAVAEAIKKSPDMLG